MMQPSASLQACLAMARASAALARRFDGRLGSFHGISFADLALLYQLSLARLRRVDLADQLGLTSSAVTRALIPLEKVGLVRREPDTHDARVSYASLTSAGRRVLEEARETAEAISREAFPENTRQVSALARTLDRMAAPDRSPWAAAAGLGAVRRRAPSD